MFRFFFNDTATTEIYTLSLHDALPISVVPPHGLEVGLRPGPPRRRRVGVAHVPPHSVTGQPHAHALDRKSTRLNSSHANISYAVFCLKKKKKTPPHSVLKALLPTRTTN